MGVAITLTRQMSVRSKGRSLRGLNEWRSPAYIISEIFFAGRSGFNILIKHYKVKTLKHMHG